VVPAMNIFRTPLLSKPRCIFTLPLFFVMVSVVGAQQRSLITKPVDDSSRTTIQGSVHPLARPEYDVGGVGSQVLFEQMILVLGPAPEQDAALPAFLDSQQDKTSPNYHHWLSPEEFGEQFGPSPADLQQVVAWLQQVGFRVDAVAQSGRWIEFSGSTQQVETAFRTQMRRYQVNGTVHTANATEISIPAALAPVVLGVASLHDFFSRPLVSNVFTVRRNSQGALVPVDPDFTFTGVNGTAYYLAPGDFASIYNLTPLYQAGLTGAGQTIAIVARAPIEFSDIETFRQIFGLSANDPNVILAGSAPSALYTDDALEATLDAEWSGAVAPNATVTLVVNPSTVTSDGVDLSAAYIVDNDVAEIMSASFEACEQSAGPAENAFHKALWQQAAAQGISVFVAAGDNGAAGCDAPADPNDQPAKDGLAVNGFASTPYNTAVGGTEFNELGNYATYWNTSNASGFSSAKGYIPETVWNESCDPTVPGSACFGKQYSLYAGGGGASTIYGKPSWQTGTGVPADGARDLPDVALSAAGGHDGYLFCWGLQQGCETSSQGAFITAGVVGGTSVSSPTFAGIIALVAQQAGGRLGLANYVLYRLAASQQNLGSCNSTNQTNSTVRSTCVFNDVTTGNNNVPGQVGYSAQAGYDQATGLGSVDAANLVNQWNSVSFQGSSTTLASAQTQVQHGQPFPLTVTVSAASGSGVPTGSVALYSDKFGPAGLVGVTGGTFAGSVSSLPGGQYNLTAHYQGDGTFGSSSSDSIPINISTENSSLTLSAYTYNSNGPVLASSLPYGNFVYFHAQVVSASGNGTPTGTVTFQDGTTVLETFSVDSKGGAELVSGADSNDGATLCLTPGSHSISANYSGDNSFNAASSQPYTFAVTKANATVLFSDTNPLDLVPGQVLPISVFVENAGPILPTGTVQFLDNETPFGNPVTIGSAVPDESVTASTQVTLSTGAHSITATYSGDALYFSGSSIDSLPVTVAAGTGTPTQTTLIGPVSAVTIGQQIVYTVSVTSAKPTPVPTGTIQLNGPLGEPTGPAALQNGSATIPVSPIIPGPTPLFAQYSGDSIYAPSGSAPVTVNVLKATPAITLTASSSSIAAGSPVRFVTTVIDPTPAMVEPGDMVQYSDSFNGAAAQPMGGPRNLTFGNPYNDLVYVLSTVLPAGTHVITSQFLGDDDLNPVTANSVTVVVAGSSFQFSASSNTLTVTSGQSGSVVLTLTPSGGFNASTTLSCGTPLPSGATCSISPNPVTCNGSAATTTLTLSTIAPSSSATQSSFTQLRIWPGFGGGIALAGLVLILWPRRGTVLGVTACIVFAAVLFSYGCGGSGSGSSSSSPPPPSGPASTTTTLASSGIKTAQGNNVTLSATVTSSLAGATGSVIFFDSGAALGQSVSLTAGVAQLQLNSLSVGTHAITAEYGGDSNHDASTSSILEQAITGSVQIQITASGGGQNKALPIDIVIQ
jgi:large repetitive protein